jgi:putative addiction module component (TIGR02574 family)
MRGTKEIIEQASSLPIEERVSVVDSLLKTLNAPDVEIDRKWTEVAKRRLKEIRSGKVKTIPGNRVFEKVKERFSK